MNTSTVPASVPPETLDHRERSTTRTVALRLAGCLLLGVLAAVRYWIAYNPDATLKERIEPLSVAHSLFSSGRFANPFGSMETGDSAHLAPAFPALVALVMSGFGEGAQGAYVLNLISVAAMALQVAVFPLVATSLGMGFLTGLIAGGLWLLAKPPLYASWECTLAALLLLMASWLFRRLIVAQSPGGSGSVLLGLSMGLLVLLMQTVLPVIVIWIGWLAYIRRSRLLRGWNSVVFLIPLLLVSGWAFRNYLVFHRFIVVRDNLGLELAVSNNDCAVYGLFLSERTGCFQAEHPNVNPAEAQKIFALGEPQYNDARMRQALTWISDHPQRFAHLTLARFIAFWFPNESGSPVIDLVKPGFRTLRIVVYTMTLLSLLGLITLFPRDPTSASVCALWLALFPAAYYIIQYVDRYRVPILWVTFLLGAFPIALAITTISRKARACLHPGLHSRNVASRNGSPV